MSEQPSWHEPPAPSAPQRVHWNRVFLYTGVLFAATFLVGCAGGFVTGISGRGDSQTSAALVWVRAAFMIAAMAGVFAWIGRVQVVLTEGHAALTWVLGTILGFVLNVLLLGQPISGFMCSTVAFAAFAALGTFVGAATRRRWK